MGSCSRHPGGRTKSALSKTGRLLSKAGSVGVGGALSALPMSTEPNFCSLFPTRGKFVLVQAYRRRPRGCKNSVSVSVSALLGCLVRGGMRTWVGVELMTTVTHVIAKATRRVTNQSNSSLAMCRPSLPSPDIGSVMKFLN